jgi:hypothetical protein
MLALPGHLLFPAYSLRVFQETLSNPSGGNAIGSIGRAEAGTSAVAHHQALEAGGNEPTSPGKPDGVTVTESYSKSDYVEESTKNLFV